MANELSTMKSIAQARAKFAWECASEYNPLDTDTEEQKKRKKKAKDEYSAAVDKVPTYIKTNGLLNTLAFLYSKSKKGNREEKLLEQICNWLTGQNLQNGVAAFPMIESSNLTTGNNLQEKVLNYLMISNAKDLIRCSTEVLALFNWLRRFAKSE
jgi:CRISPR type III-B/RAMP module-associated protein Cmr5